MPRGGRRPGAGRPLGSGKFGEPTIAIRVPQSEVEQVLASVQRRRYSLPFYESAVAAGFPSPADGEMTAELDLNDLLIKHPVSTFFVRVSGMSMVGAGIHDGDILVVDRSLQPVHGKVVIASINGELTVKRLSIEGNRVWLVAENASYAPIEITEAMELRVWGVVTSVVHSL